MNKSELETHAEEICEYTDQIHRDCFVNGYVTGALKREQKIADIKANCDLAIEGRDVKIMELETENNKLLDVINNQDVKIADLEKENAELKKESDFFHTEKGEYKSAFLKEVLKKNKIKKQLTKAKEIIKKFTEFVNNEIEYDPEHPQEHTDLWNGLCEQAEQFLKEIE